MPRPIPTARSGTAPRLHSDPTRTSPLTWSARPGAHRHAAGWRQLPRSCSAPRRSRSIPARKRGARSGPQAQSSWPGRPRRRWRWCRRRADGPLEELDRALLQRLKGQIALDLRRGEDAVPLLLDAAKRLESLDPGLARETYVEALRAASIAGRLGTGMLAAAKAARGAPPRPGCGASDRRAARRPGRPLHGWLRRQRGHAQAGPCRGSRRRRSGRAEHALAVDRSSRRAGPVR